jgi:serine protease Do
VRLLTITGVDLNVFDFDYDLTWMAFFLNANEKVLGRYGGRDADGAETRISLGGLKYAMRAALEAHGQNPQGKAAPRQQAQLYIERVPSASTYRGCIHCHQVKEILRDEKVKADTWQRQEVWVYPLPENIGIKLELDRGNVVESVVAASPAGRAGLRVGDVLSSLDSMSIHSFADAQHALHRAPAKGEIAIEWRSGGETRKANLELADGWRKTNITWRPSLLYLLPSLTVYGPDLSVQEKKRLGLGEKQLAFRQQKPVHSEAQAMGVKEGDIITSIDNRPLDMTVQDFLGHVRQNYLIGDRVVLNIIRNGKRLELPVQLR